MGHWQILEQCTVIGVDNTRAKLARTERDERTWYRRGSACLSGGGIDHIPPRRLLHPTRGHTTSMRTEGQCRFRHSRSERGTTRLPRRFCGVQFNVQTRFRLTPSPRQDTNRTEYLRRRAVATLRQTEQLRSSELHLNLNWSRFVMMRRSQLT
jgi:hypothetical protein